MAGKTLIISHLFFHGFYSNCQVREIQEANNCYMSGNLKTDVGASIPDVSIDTCHHLCVFAVQECSIQKYHEMS